MQEHGNTVCKWIIGTVSPTFGIVTSFQSEVEWWLRIIALIGGIAVSCISFFSIAKNITNKKDKP